ncbi:MAG TPA: restriction endonuclease subunit S [Fibrobacteria bacterium]|nr:restriction endonuclease subunit S [Fibrobacteria bacterium]
MSTETVPKGYKRTEVGVIPEEWEVKPVNEFGTIKTGPFGTLLKASEYTEHDGVPLISVGEVRNGFFRISDETPRVSEQVTRRLPQYILKTGDIVFGRKGGVDRSAMVRENEYGWFLGSDGIAIRPSKELAHEYLGHQFQGSTTKNWLLQNAIGSTMPSLNQEILGRVIIAIPPTVAEQQAIATALSDADALIESLEQLLAKKRQIKQGAMQELLTGKRRLPGFEIFPGFKQTEIGAIPEDWKLIAVGEVAKIGRGRVISHKEIAKSTSSMYPVYSSQTSNDGVMGYLDSFDFDGEYVTWTTDGANAGTVFYRSGKFNCTNVCGTIKLESDDPRFVSLALGIRTYGYVSRQLGNPKLMNDVLKQVKVSMPPLPEQTAIAAVLSDMDAELEALEAKLEKARQVKQGMMQQLLTGKVRLV